jgi:hypothetical protein
MGGGDLYCAILGEPDSREMERFQDGEVLMRLCKFVFGVLFLWLIPGIGFCAGVVGTVSDTQRRAVGGVEVTVQNPAGKVFGRATSDLQGHYQITGLAPDTYQYILNPLGSGFKGGTGVCYLGSKGITIDWKVSRDAPAFALASPGTADEIAGDPFGYSAAEFASLVTLGAGVVATGVVSGYGAAGGFSSGSTASPSQ